MSYYTDLDANLGAAEEAERNMRELDFERNRKIANERTRIKNEVKRQLKAQGVDLSKKPVKGEKVEAKCACCGTTFKVRKADIKRGWGKFCSKTCKARKQKYNGYLHR